MRKHKISMSIYAGDILKSYGLFIEEHDETLKKLKKKTPGFSETKNNSLISMISVIELNYVFNDSIVAQMFLEESQMVANKPLTTLANLCNQCRDLTRTAKELQLTWLLTGSKLKDQKQHLGYDLAKLEQILFRISTSIDFFCRVNFTLNRINETVQNLWTQIVAVSVLEEINELHIFTLFDYMNELLESVVVFNEIVERSYIASIWVLYKNWLATLTNNKCILDHCTTLELLGLSKALKEIESVISGNLFRTLLAHLMKLKNQTCLKDVNRITQRSNAYIRKKVFAVDINQDTEYTNIEDPKLIIRVIAFVVTIQQLGIQIEAKLVKAIFDLVTKHQLLPLIGKFRWSPHKFILEHSKTLFKTSGRFHAITGNGNKIQTSIIEKIKLNDLKTSRLLGNQIAVWSFNLKKVTDSGIFGHFKMLYNLLLSGHSYIDEICVLTNSLINRHIALRSSLVKADISLICRLLQYLMIIQDIFETNQINFIRFLDSLIQWQKQKVLFLLQNTKKKILDIKLVQRKANLLSIIKLTENIFVGFPSTKRLTFLNLALGDFLDKDRLQIGDKHNYFSSFLFRANNLGRFKQECRMKVDSSILIYILWLQNTSFFREYVELQRNSYSMQNIVAVSQQLQKSRHIFTGCEDNKHSPNTLMIEFLKLHFEFFLRVEALSHFFQNQDEPFQKQRLDYRLCLTSTASEFLGSYDIIRGNAVGYVRLLQAGSKNSNYRSRSYMSIYENNFNSAGPRGMHTVTENSIGEYGKNVGHMKECYSDCTNYFKLLLLGFKPFLCNPNNHHLKTFFLITPAVITNYIEYRVKEKLKVHKKDQTNSSVFEDGFAIGLIYILCMLNQLGDFHELSWSKSTANQLYAERSKVTSIVEGQKVSAGHVDEKLLQTVAITERHVNAYEHEYNLLYATLSSAEIFFQ
ncbi:WASH complex subunit 4 isoform X2 [Drosophila bipectinata]|uniref:WASH complex subunit 4 isoform X2 n=1 Tax=Drosophila bipectinata TaxID=42026 RepID=UPI0038B2A471